MKLSKGEIVIDNSKFDEDVGNEYTYEELKDNWYQKTKKSRKKSRRKSKRKSRRKSKRKSRRKSKRKSRRKSKRRSRRKSRRNCEHGELKKPVRNSDGSYRYCKKERKKSPRKSPRKSREKSGCKQGHCTSGKVVNPRTGRCIKKDGAIGRKECGESPRKSRRRSRRKSKRKSRRKSRKSTRKESPVFTRTEMNKVRNLLYKCKQKLKK